MSRPNVSSTRKPQILMAALQTFLENGFDAARMEDIAAKAELSVGNLYRYFPGKLDLTVALMDLILAPSLQKLKDLVDEKGSCRQRLEAAFIEDLAGQNPQDMFLYAEMCHLARYEPAVQKMLKSYNARYQKQIQLVIEQGIERGELKRADPAAIAFAFQAIYDGIMQNVPLMRQNFDVAAALKQMFALVFEGLEKTM